MDTTPITGVDELEKHLDELVQDPNLTLNAKLFDDVELQLTDSNIPSLIVRLLPRITVVLKQYIQDPTILAGLAIKLLGPLSFSQVLGLASQESLIQALNSPAPAANLLGMTVLHKAAATPADAAILSSMTPFLGAFIQRWLAAPQVEVGQKGGKVLGDLLDTDCELPPPPPGSVLGTEVVTRRSPGQGLLWRRIFRDRDIFSILVNFCAGRQEDTAGDAKQLSLAQGRLLRLLPRLAALNFSAVSSAELPLPTPAHATNGHAESSGEAVAPRPRDGLLQWAALRMVDHRDLLMQLSVVDFFEAFVSLMRVSGYSAHKVETIRGMLREAFAMDDGLRDALLTLPDRTVPEEADDLRRWLQEVVPAEPVRVQGSWL